MMRPQRLRIIAIVSGCGNVEEAGKRHVRTLCHCAALMPGKTASFVDAALFTSTWIGVSAMSASSVVRLASASVIVEGDGLGLTATRFDFIGQRLRFRQVAVGVNIDVAAVGGEAAADRRTDAAAAAGDERAFHVRFPSLLASSTTAARPLSNSRRRR